MQKFCEIAIIIVIILLIYIVFRTENFIQSVGATSRAREFNFKNDAHGYSQADHMLAGLLNRG